ncbi:MAG: PEP-CTERM sorting domain-containing protein, partial [Cephaloticoccus sp.]|nr:PEP-CTERM sorting domain-containing protein [Cephaloticoccus sp.]
STGPDFYSVRSSLDNYSTNLSSDSAPLNPSGSITATSLTLPTSITYSAITTTTQFRIYGWGATGSSGSLSVNAFSMTGNLTAVPEPSTYAAILGGVALVGVAVIRRRKRAKIA